MRMHQVVALIVTLALGANIAFAGGGTAFTYQGRLLDAGEPANGLFDFRFALFGTEIGGVPVGAVQIDDTLVTDGLFTVEIDYGADAFDNTARWLEIVVGQIPLSPRQPITRAPYAIQTRGMFIGDDGNVLFHSLNEAEGTVTISSIGGVDVMIDADTNNIGEDQNARIVMTQDGGQVVARMGYREGANDLEIMQEYDSDLILGTNNVDRLTIAADGNIGIGTNLPQYALEVVGDGTRTIFGRNTSNAGAAAGVLGLSASTGGWGVAGFTTATSGGTIGVFGQCDSTIGSGVSGFASATSGITNGVRGTANSTSGRGVFGWATDATGTNYGVYGQSNSTDGFDFYAGGAGTNYGSFSSIRWKSNVRNIDQPLEKIARLRGVYFDWDKEHGGHHDVGMIAEEVGEVLPEIVNYEENGIDAIGMDYSKLTPLLVEAVNALRAENEALHAQQDATITALQQQIYDLRNLVEELVSTLEDNKP